MPQQPIFNFGKNIQSTPQVFAQPQDESELLQVLETHRDKSFRVVASGHAWSEGIVTDDVLISVESFKQIRIAMDKKTVTVGAGCQIKDLLRQLHNWGVTLPSVGLIDEQTVAGATATGTHGSGKPCLSNYIQWARLAHFDSQTDRPVITEVFSGADLQAAQCSLGLLGVVIELELECRPLYNVQEHSARHDSLDSVLAAEANYPLQQFYLMPCSWQWFAQHRQETDQSRSWLAGLFRTYWYLGIDWGLHIVVWLSAKKLRSRFLIRNFYRRLLPLVFVRNWKVVDDSHAMLTMEHELFQHIEIEIFVKRSQLAAALEHVQATMTFFAGDGPTKDSDAQPAAEQYGQYFHHYPICVRRVAVDDTFVSATSKVSAHDDEDWYAISMISYDRPEHRDGFFAFAQYITVSMHERFEGRCHWGKHNPSTRTMIRQQYPQLEHFRQAVQRFDARGRFANAWLQKTVLAD